VTTASCRKGWRPGVIPLRLLRWCDVTLGEEKQHCDGDGHDGCGGEFNRISGALAKLAGREGGRALGERRQFRGLGDSASQSGEYMTVSGSSEEVKSPCELLCAASSKPRPQPARARAAARPTPPPRMRCALCVSR
jgi:hypothetical protein